MKSVFSSKPSESSPEVLNKIRALQCEIRHEHEALPPFQRVQLVISRASLWTPVTALPLTDDREGLGVTVTDLENANSVILIGTVGNNDSSTMKEEIFLFNDCPVNRWDGYQIDGKFYKYGDTLPEKYRKFCL